VLFLHQALADLENLGPTSLPVSMSVGHRMNPNTISLSAPSAADSPPPAGRQMDSRPSQPPGQEGVLGPSFKTLAQAKKRAQAAILNLWPLDVRYQSYIDEGIDEMVVKSLFSDLKLDLGAPKPSPGTHAYSASPSSQPSSSKLPNKPATEPTSSLVELLPQPPAERPKDSATSSMDQSEERKDRIRRLLAAKAEKKANAPAASPSVAPAPSGPSSLSAAGVSQIAQGKGKTKSNLLLQQKIEAFKKRQAQATPQGNGMVISSQQLEIETPTSMLSTSSVAGAADIVNQEASTTALNAPSGPGPSSHIPGLFLSPVAQTLATSNHRKRPVALDFVDDGPAASYKRPFGQDRDKPLVIDISDGSDDEDVEMDMGSPTEAPSLPAQRPDTLRKKTTSFRHVPPLSDSYARHLSSPAPAANTPPNGAVAQAKEKLERMEREMEEMRKRIAEANARKKLKQTVNGSSPSALPTPNGATSGGSEPVEERTEGPVVPIWPTRNKSPAPSQHATASTARKLPKPSKMRPTDGETKTERRNRIVSQTLPAMEAAIQEKRSKIQLMESEMARLQQEVEQERAEKKRIADELKQLEDEMANEAKQQHFAPVLGKCPLAMGALQGFDLNTGTVKDFVSSVRHVELIASFQASNGTSAQPASSQIAPSGGAQSAGQSASANDDEASRNSQTMTGGRIGGLASHDEGMNLRQPEDNLTADLPKSLDITSYSSDLRPHANPLVDDGVTLQTTWPDSGLRKRRVSSVLGANDLPVVASSTAMQGEDVGRIDNDDDSSEAYEPPAAEESGLSAPSNSTPSSPARADGSLLPEASDTDSQVAMEVSPVAEQISIGIDESSPEDGQVDAREVLIVSCRYPSPIF
jgi:hypothetical protein